MPDAIDALAQDLTRTAGPLWTRAKLQALVQSKAEALGVPVPLALALVHQESDFDPLAESPTGVVGLAQVTKATGAQYGQGPQHRMNPDVSTEAGLRYFRDLLTQSRGDTRQALQRYNGGSDPGYADKVLARVPQYAQASQGDEIDQLARSLGVTTRGATPGPVPASPAPQAPARPAPPGPVPTRPGEAPLAPQPGRVGTSTEPSDLVIDIGGPAPAPPPAFVSPHGFTYEGNLLSDTSTITPEGLAPAGTLAAQATGALKQGAAMGLQGVATAAGGALGVLTGPAAPVVSPLLAGAASYGGHRLNQYLGLTPGTPTLGPQTLDDYLALGLPMAPLAPMAARQALRYSRGGRALRAAETATQDAQAAYEAELAGQYAQRRAAVQQAERVAQEQTAAQQAAYEADLAGQYAQRRALLQTAEREAVETNAANRAAWEARGQEQYRQAAAAAQADSARKSGDLAAYNTAVQEQRDAVTRLQALPGQYLPKMPARNAVDVRQDMAMLDQGGQVAESVVKRLGAEDVFDAMGMLKQEADTFAQAGRTPRPGEAIAPSYRLPQARGGAQQGTELQTFLRQQGGLRLTNEELQGEFRALVTRKESGVSGLLNNRSGKSAQQLAEAAQEQGYIPTADKEALLEALRQSVTEGKPVYSRLAGEASFFGESPTPLPGQPRPTMSRNPGHQASSILYNRLEEVAGSAPVDLSLPMQTAMDFQAQLGVSMPAMQPSRLQKILTDLADMGDRGSVAQVHQAMKDLGPLTRSTDSKTKFMATQLRNALDDALEASSVEWPETAGARQLLQQAKGAWKQESAALDLEHLLRTGGPVIRSRGGTVTISPDALFNQVEAELAKPYSFLRQLPADQQAALRADIASFRGTPKIPTQPPMPPDAAPLPGAMSLRGMEPPTPVEPTYPRPVSVGPRPAPVEPAYPRPVSVGPAPPPVAPQVPWRGRRVLGEGVTIPLLVSAVTGPGLKAAMAGGAVLTAETLSYVLAKAMISPRVRPMVLAAMRAGGEISPELYGILGALAAEHTERGQP